MRSLIIFIFLVCYSIGFAQIDTIVVNNILKVAGEIRFSDPSKSSELYVKVIKYSDSIDFPLGEHKAKIGLGILSFHAGEYDQSIVHYQEALNIAEKMEYTKGIGNSYLDMAISWYYKGELIKSTSEYLKSLDYYYKVKDTFAIITVYQNVGLIFADIQQYEKSNEYILKSLELAKLTQDSIKIAANSLNMGMNYAKTMQHNKALEQFMFVKNIADAVNYPQLSFHIHQNLGQHYLDVNEPDKALPYALNAYEFIKPINSKPDISNCFGLLGNIYKKLGNNELAQSYYIKAYNLGEEIESPDLVINTSLSLSQLYASKNEFKNAYKYANNYIVLYDSIRGEKNRKLVAGIEAQYEFEKKNNEILKQQLEIETKEAFIQKKINQNGIYLTGLIILLFTSFFFWYRHRQKQKLNKQTIQTLNKQQELKTLEALIQGEDLERSRIAKDLHDSVNGNLSAIKHNLSSISQENLKDDEHDTFDSAIQMLDTACEQVRSISHDLVPPSLMNYGIIEALEQYINRINSIGIIKITYQHFGILNPLSKKTETTIYHIVQELLANVIKHSQAKKAIIQINADEDTLHITVEDDGKGYDTNMVFHGLGLNNIKSRIQFLNAEMDIKSDEKGTSVTIDIDIKKIQQL